MTQSELSTKDRLIRSAAMLFRIKGYHGVGLNDILSEANAPKGSLYHHFPGGKPDLALAAATWASDGMLRLIATSFDGATTFKEAATTLCYKLAKFFDESGKWDGCPIYAILFEGPENAEFRDHAQRLYEGWIAEAADQAIRLGDAPDRAQARSEQFFILMQGGWTLARARRSSDVLRALPDLMPD